MKNNNKETYNFDFIQVITFLFKWKKPLIIVTLLAAVLSFVVSQPMFITPKYKSSCVFYPGTINTLSAYLFYNTKDRGRDFLEFGDDEIAEQYLQIASSGELAGRVINKFNLADHYKIPADNPKRVDLVFNKFYKNVEVKRTNFNAIEIKVLDSDPQLAADIANSVMGMVDTVKTEIQRKVALQAHEAVEKTYFAQVARMDSIKDRMKELGKSGIYNSAEQSKGLAEVIGKGQNNSFTERERKNLAEFGPEYTMLEELLKYEAEILADLGNRYAQSKVDISRSVSNIFVVSYATVPQTKAYPIKSIIVLISAISAFVVACIVIVFIENFKKVKARV